MDFNMSSATWRIFLSGLNVFFAWPHGDSVYRATSEYARETTRKIQGHMYAFLIPIQQHFLLHFIITKHLFNHLGLNYVLKRC